MKLVPLDPEQSFEAWARVKYNELLKVLNFCNEDGSIDPVRINFVMSQFAQHFAWAITIQEVETNRLNRLVHEFDQWKAEKFNICFRSLREEAAGAGRAPAQATVEARIVQMYGQEQFEKLGLVETQRNRVELLKGFVKVLDRQATILQSLSSNMRSELFFAAGVPTTGTMPNEARMNASKAIMREALRKNGDDSIHKQTEEEISS
jgi:hypothetical protein